MTKVFDTGWGTQLIKSLALRGIQSRDVDQHGGYSATIALQTLPLRKVGQNSSIHAGGAFRAR
jgi:hypothetical protein